MSMVIATLIIMALSTIAPVSTTYCAATAIFRIVADPEFGFKRRGDGVRSSAEGPRMEAMPAHRVWGWAMERVYSIGEDFGRGHASPKYFNFLGS